MPTARFFCPTPLQADSQITLPESLAHHALRVLRLPAGTTVILFDGRGGQYPAVLQTQGRTALADVGRHETVECELRGHLTLIQGIASGDKMDWVVEKAVELGVSTLIPVAADRSVLRLSGPRLEKRLARWQAIIQAASEQCGRNRLMQIHEPAPLRDHLAALNGLSLFCHPDGDSDFSQALSNAQDTLNVLVGPEGGWSPEELDLARHHGLQGVRFGPRVLRTETAGLAMTAAATALLGW
ncbi:MAG: 16S rRNA (uracil(1498)-N(3))-methyltransferase [Castellaniella sp.]|uniref:16S rRNA (uracil(1498)-N(3))-methyltransferase n=1 Tax=Castellaniella sp. TaxID=1955812 RepID=UPI003C74E897